MTAEWLRPSRCVAGECVEVRATADGVQVRDSKHPDQPPLAFTGAEWDAFCAGVKAGEYDGVGPSGGAQAAVDASEPSEGRSGHPRPSQAVTGEERP